MKALEKHIFESLTFHGCTRLLSEHSCRLFCLFISISHSTPDDFSLHFPITDSENFSKSSDQTDRDNSEKGGLIGGSDRPASCPSSCFFSLYLPFSSSSFPPSAGNRALFQRRGDDKIKRKLHWVFLIDKTREVGGWKLQTTFEKMGSGQGEVGWTRARQTHPEKRRDKPSGIWGHGRWGLEDWEGN